MNTYGMRNVSIEKIDNYGWPSWLIYADTERFGIHEIMAQFGSLEEATHWCRENGVEIEPVTAVDRIMKEIGNGSGKVQIGNAMYRNLYLDGEKIMGYSHRNGWCNLTEMVRDCKMLDENTGKTPNRFGGRQKTLTVRFGNTCTW